MRTYGTVEYKPDKKSYVIECEPHVSMVLKRVFPKLGRHSQGKHWMTDTLQTSADLAWFLKRYPMTVKGLEHLQEQERIHCDGTTLVEDLLSRRVIPQPFELAVPAREYQSLAANVWLTKKNLLLADDVGLGKAQPLDSLVLTPRGWARIGNLRIDDDVIDPDGGTAKVTGVYPQGQRDVYRLTTADGASTECCDEHLWLVLTPNDRVRNGERVLQLREFRRRLTDRRGNGNKCSNYFLPMVRPVDFGSREKLEIHPYLLGVLLGDGCLQPKSIGLSSADSELIDKIKNLLPPGVSLIHDSGCDWRLSSHSRSGVRNSLLSHLRSLGIAGKRSWEKSVPEKYKTAKSADRLELLRGLMDTDGTCDKYGASCTFTTTSPALATDVRELVASLGGFASTYSRKTKYTYKGEQRTGRQCWTLNIRVPENPFSLKRKVERWHPPLLARAIKSIALSGLKETVCIRVSSKRSLYVTDGYIVTHNTATAICGFTDPRTLPALVVTMTHLPRQWKAEIEKFAPNLRTHIIKRGTPYDLTERRRSQQMLLPESLPDVLIINYHKLGGWAETLSKIVKSVVFDEVQELRNDKAANKFTQKYAAAKQIAGHCDYRIGLSATPIYNYGDEMFNVMDVLSPGALGSRDEFLREWCTFAGSGKFKIKEPKTFGSYMRDSALMLRRTRADVGRELPPIVKIHQSVDADAEALDKVGDSCAELARIILAQGESYKGQKMESAGRLDNIIRQATGIAKAPYVAEAVKLIIESGEKVVLYGWHRSVYDIWMERLKEFNPVMYTGSESVPQKEEAKRKFIAGESQVFIISLRSGAGLDGLQNVARTVCFGELDWSPGVHEQNIGRVARDGQDEHTMVYFFISDSGSDPTMAEVLGIKKMQVEGIRGDKQELVEVLQADGNHIRKLAEMYLQKRAVAS